MGGGGFGIPKLYVKFRWQSFLALTLILALIVLIYNTYIKLLLCNLNCVIFLPHKDYPLVHLQSHVLITDCYYLGSYVGVKELLLEFLGILFRWKGICHDKISLLFWTSAHSNKMGQIYVRQR